MSWQLAALGVLAVALAIGFAWYERSRPDARVVALVATLAALAVVGRIAFAAVPNVKPSTDIVLISGFALGAAPGFVVGALTGLVSNFFFGQGPWTVWQMAGWAAVGVCGAALARLSGGRLARWPLALACLLVGFAYTALQDAGDWVNYSDHSPAQLGVYVAKGLGFDAVHAVGCLAFALIFGPALARALGRFQLRLEVTWADGAAAGAVALVALAGAPLAAVRLAAAPAARAAATPLGYLLSAQNADGGFGSAPGQASSQLYAGWAALGLAADGVNPADVGRAGTSLLSYVSAGVPSISDVGSLERTILVARAAGASATSFGGRDLTGELTSHVRADGSVSEQVNLTAFAILALRAASAPVPAHSLAWLLRQQNRDGGFGFGTAGGASDPDDTGAVLEALAADGGAGRARTRAVRFLSVAQNRDGGLPAQSGGASDAQSTAWAVQGLLAAGVDPDRLHRHGAPSPLDYLRALTAADGHVRYAAGSDETPVWVTAQALMALARKPLPLAPVPRATRAAPLPHAAASPSALGRSGGGALSATARRGAGAATPASRSAGARRRHEGAAAGDPFGLGEMAAGEEAALMQLLSRLLAPAGL